MASGDQPRAEPVECGLCDSPPVRVVRVTTIEGHVSDHHYCDTHADMVLSQPLASKGVRSREDVTP